MSIDDLTIGQIKELKAMLGLGNPSEIGTPAPQHCGLCIVVADQGFVSVGDLTIGERYVLTNERTIRRWGTTEGLGELVVKGPLSNTILDSVVPVKEFERKAVLFFIPIQDASKWSL